MLMIYVYQYRIYCKYILILIISSLHLLRYKLDYYCRAGMSSVVKKFKLRFEILYKLIHRK